MTDTERTTHFFGDGCPDHPACGEHRWFTADWWGVKKCKRCGLIQAAGDD